MIIHQHGSGATADGKNKNKMKTLRQMVLLPAAIAMLSIALPANAQEAAVTNPLSEGVVVYSLPSTSLHLTVEAVREVYTPGPYAKYAKKYLGIDIPAEGAEKYQLSSVKLVPYLEADMNKRYVANLGSLSKNAPANFFEMTTQGLVVLSDQKKGNKDFWRFPTLADNFDMNAAGATENFISAETTLYKNVRKSDGSYDRVAVQQSQVVEKSTEKKAQEIANAIFSLRKKRLQIITGDTDATFSGEALGAAIEEISRLENDYMSLFLGKTETAVQKMSFDVLPKADLARQIYVAFRFSDSQGLLLPANVSGRPIVLELIPEAEDAAVVQTVQEPVVSKKVSIKKDADTPKMDIYYRVPSVCMVKILDGQELLLQTRIPVYQLGQTLSFPIETLIK